MSDKCHFIATLELTLCHCVNGKIECVRLVSKQNHN